MKTITQQELKSLFRYEPETGIFTRLVTRGNVVAGTIVVCKDRKGYLRIGINRFSFLAHRLAFVYMIGKEPTNEVDHINGKRDDNRWTNLRDASAAQNACNRKTRRDNKNGLKGVKWNASNKQWHARIQHRGRRVHLGIFKTKELAHEFYCLAADLLHGDFSNYGSVK